MVHESIAHEEDSLAAARVVPISGPRVIESPGPVTRTWKPVYESGVQGYRDAEGVVWVAARADEEPELIVTFTRMPGLPPGRFVRAVRSWAVKGAQTRERRQQRELRKRGYA